VACKGVSEDSLQLAPYAKPGLVPKSSDPSVPDTLYLVKSNELTH